MLNPQEARRGGIVGVGLVNKDYVASVPRWERDHKSEATTYFEQMGGPVPVALTALARLSETERVAFVGVVGDDHDGDDTAMRLRASGIEPYLTHAPGIMTSKSLVILDQSDSTRTLANYGAGLPPLDLSPEQEALLADARLVHLDGRDLPSCLRAARIVRAAGGVVSYDLGTMRPGREELLRTSDIVLASRKGAAGAFPDTDAPERWVRGFLNLGARIAGVTLAHEGVIIAEQGRDPIRLPAFAVPRVVDTCGAGDTFHGAFLHAYLSGGSARDCADFAQAAVALRIQRLGNDAGLPRRAEVEAFLAAKPPRG